MATRVAHCIFCKIVAGELPADTVYEDDSLIAFLDIAPLNPGHTLVVPKEHHTSVTTVPAHLTGAMLSTAARVGTAMMRATGANGFNLILSNGTCAGQVVPHVHLHVVPRFPDDGIVLPTRTVPYESDEAKQEILDRARARLTS